MKSYTAFGLSKYVLFLLLGLMAQAAVDPSLSVPIRQIGEWSQFSGNYPDEIQIVENRAYVDNWYGGFHVLDVSNPEKIIRLGGYNTSGGGQGMEIVGSRIYLADGYSGLRILDVSSPTNILQIGNFRPTGKTMGVEVVGNIAYLASWEGGLHILNISNPAQITRLGGYDTPGRAKTVQVIDTTAYIADEEGGLHILNVSNPSQIIRLGGYQTPDLAEGLQVTGNRAYLSCAGKGLVILDVSNPAQVIRLGGYQTENYAAEVQVIGSLAYLADYQKGFHILDISNPANVKRLGGIYTLGSCYEVEVVNTAAYVADGIGGIKVYELNSGIPIPGSINTVADWTFEDGSLHQIPSQIADASGNRISGRVLGRPVYMPTTRGSGLVSLYLPSETGASGFAVDEGGRFTFTNAFTLEAEISINQQLSSNSGPIIRCLSSSLQRTFYSLDYLSDSKKIRFRFAPAESALFEMEAPIPNNAEPLHVAAVVGTNTVSLFLNGALVNQTNATFTSVGLASAQLLIGIDEKSETGYRGYLNRIRISDSALESSQFFAVNQWGAIKDGIPATWRLYHFPANSPLEDLRAVADPDQDGASNFREFLDGTNPLDSQSVKTKPLALFPFLGTVEGGLDGDRTVAQFDYPGHIRFDSQGRLWISEINVPDWESAVGPSRVRILDTNGIVRTVAGTNQPGFADGKGIEALFRGPSHYAMAKSGDVFLTDRLNHRIRRIDTNWNVSTFAGSIKGDRDGQGTNAQFHIPQGLDIDSKGNLYVADFMNSKIKKIDPEGNVSTAAIIRAPTDVTIDKDGTLFIASWESGTIYRMTPDGNISVFATSIPYIEMVKVGPDDRIYATSPSPVFALFCFSKTGTLLWRTQFTPGNDYLPVTPPLVHTASIEFLPTGDLLVVDSRNNLIRTLQLGVEPLIRASLGSTSLSNKLVMSTPIERGEIFYTIDGTEPTPHSLIYREPLAFNSSLTYRARVFFNQYAVSEMVIFNPQPSNVMDDGIPASWRATYFGNDCQAETCSAIADPDQDGASNYREYLDGTHPLDSQSVKIKPFSVTPFLGTVEGGVDGDHTAAQFSLPSSLAFDAQARLWITELNIPTFDTAAGASRVRILETNGIVRTVAGTNMPGFAEGQGVAALFRGPQSLAIAKSGDVFLTDRLNHRIRRIDTNWNVTTFAGSSRGDLDGKGTNAQFYSPMGLAMDQTGNLFVADFMNNKVKKIDSSGMVSTVAQVSAPDDVAVDEEGSLYIAAWAEGAIYRIPTNGPMTVFARSIPYCESVSVGPDGRIYAASPTPGPALLCYDKTGTMLWRVQFSPGMPDYIPSSPRISNNSNIEFLPDGNILIADRLNHLIRVLQIGVEPLIRIAQQTSGDGIYLVMNTPISRGEIHFTMDGTEPTLSSPAYAVPLLWNPTSTYRARVFVNQYPVSEVAVFAAQPDSAATMDDGIPASWRYRYFGTNCVSESCGAIADPDQDGVINYREYLDGTNPLDNQSAKIKPISISPFLGTTQGGADGDRSVAQFDTPGRIKFDSKGRLWITELTIPTWETATGPSRIRILETNGTVRTVAGTNASGFAEGKGIEAIFAGPHDLAFAKSGDVFVPDYANHRIRRLDTNWTVSTFAGGIRGDKDGLGLNAQLHGPKGIGIDSRDNLYVADLMNHKVKKIDTNGYVTTLSYINSPMDVTVDKGGNIYVASWGDGAIYRITPTGYFSVFARSIPYIENVEVGPDDRVYATSPSPLALYCFTSTGSLLWKYQPNSGPDYLPSNPSVSHFNGLEFLASGDLLFVDTLNHLIRRLNIGTEPLVQILLETTPQGTNLVMTSSIENGAIHYTMNGDEPSYSSPTYRAALLYNPSITYRARVYHNQYPVSELAVLNALTKASQSIRDLPDHYQPGQKLTVTLTVTPASFSAAYALEDQPPIGWAVSDISHNGVFDASNNKVKFGPFFDSQPRLLSYQVISPSTDTSMRSFRGFLSEDNQTSVIGGDQEISPTLTHPADSDPADWRLSLPEITSYGAAWKKGIAWLLPPNPIPISYVTRAALLWKGGETYLLDPELTNLPMAWVNSMKPLTPASTVGKLAMSAESTALSDLPARYFQGRTIDVVLSITPNLDTQAYAVQESLPQGWKAQDISQEGIWDGEVIRWGPFFDNSPRTLSYKAIPSETTSRTVFFRGVASFDGRDIEIGGQRRTSNWILNLLTRPDLNQEFSFKVESETGTRFTIEFSQDLKTWMILENLTNLTGSVIYRDPVSRWTRQGFYRITPQ